jgi:chemotaxis family two-component system sensor kinase Cph1
MGDPEDRGDAGRALAASEERYRLISEVISDYTFSTKLDSEGRLFLNWVAGAFERITGYTYEEYVARGGWLATLHPDDLEQDARDMEALRSNQPVVTELRTLTKGGAVRWVRVYGHPVWDPERSQLVGIYGAVQDVTERRQAEAEREALIRELEAKNAELERFSYTVSHDLKSPLITIQGFLSFVERDALAGNVDRLKADIARIADAVGKMQRLLSELLELSRIGRVVNPPEAVSLGSLAREAEALVAGRISERRVQVVIADGLPTVWGDHDRLREVVQNLLDNAVKFMGDQARPVVEIGARDEAGAQVFYVRDNGKGIDTAFRERVFGLFEKLDRDSEGTGVGLALVKRIVELHRGRVWIEPGGDGCGTTVCFTLPGAPAEGIAPPRDV